MNAQQNIYHFDIANQLMMTISHEMRSDTDGNLYKKY